MQLFDIYIINNQLIKESNRVFRQTDVLRVAAVGDFGALHCQPAQKFDSSTQLQFCTSPPIAATRC